MSVVQLMPTNRVLTALTYSETLRKLTKKNFLLSIMEGGGHGEGWEGGKGGKETFSGCAAAFRMLK